MDQSIILEVSQTTQIDLTKVEKTLSLLFNECTVPFIARYRKEVTGGLNEVQIRDIRDQYEHLYLLNERKNTILRSVSEQGKLTPELETKIKQTKNRQELEDIYLPFKPKKRTRGQIACERGLDKVAQVILAQDAETNLVQIFENAVGSHAELSTLENVIDGVKDYIAEYISEISDIRSYLRKWGLDNAAIRSNVTEKFKDTQTKFNNYYEYSEPVKNITPHRIMALRRAEKEGILTLSFDYDQTIPLDYIFQYIVKDNTGEEIKNFLRECINESFKRFLSTHLATEIRLETKQFAETEAIRVFEKNLKHLLLLPPIHKRTVIGLDPGFRTGSKLVVVDKTGKLLEYTTIHPEFSEDLELPKNKSIADTFLNAIRKHGVSLIAIGNGTAGRELEGFVKKILAQHPEFIVRTVIVNEAGASVYSASDVAREEFPDLDITIRGAVSIARRLQDPLSELVKIDPKSIGVGQYQHDVNQSKLKKQLTEVVETCVNYVGVNLNTASPHLLAFVAGLGPHVSKTIVQYRNEHGEFKQRTDLLNIPGFGPKTFEQAAGFLKILDGENPLDNTSVHPESYDFVADIAQKLSLTVQELLGNKEHLSKIKPQDFVTETIGLPTVQDILRELQKPGRDPREDGAKHSYNREIRKFEQLEEGQVLVGTVTNVANFGAFVDIGVHQDGLIHVSELAHQFITDVSKVIHVGDTVQVKVIGLDKERKRISLSKKACEQKVVVQEKDASSVQMRPKRNFDHPTATKQNFKNVRPASTSQKQTQHTPKQNEVRTTVNATLAELMNKYNANRV